MLTSDDVSQMQADLLAVRDDNAVSVVLRRGDSSLAAQSVRVARSGGRAIDKNSPGAGEVRGQVIVAGDVDLDIQIDDRFTVDGVLYRVTFVRPNRRCGVVAEAEVVE